MRGLEFKVFYSPEDKEWVAIVTNSEDYKYLSWLDCSPLHALEGLIDVIEELIKSGI
jgi:hypothetical protein